MPEPIWELNRMEGKNPVHTGGFLSGYDHRGFSPEEVAARESGQNSGDAGRSISGLTRLEFREFRLSGKHKEAFIERFQFREMFAGRLEEMGLEAKNKAFCDHVNSFLGDGDASLLLIRDYNTCGLGGAWNEYEKGDHFARLVCALNLDDKADGDDHSGGSYGLGKTAYAKSSAVNTVIYHSVFAPTPRTDGVSRRLMGAGVYPRHSHNGHRFGGFAYFGPPDDDGESVARPFENEDAADVWRFIGQAVGEDLSRSDKETGTDILILAPTLDLMKVKTAIEDYYFPAIIDREIAVSFIDKDGHTHHPKVYERADLRQFIDLWKDAKRGEQIRTDHKEVANLNKYSENNIGVIAFEAANDAVSDSVRRNCIAYMRGTGMVISYAHMGSEQYEPAAGVFIANKDIYRYLIASENAAHSEWSEQSQRLESYFPTIGKDIVRRVNSVVSNRFSAFRKNLQPDIVSSRSENGLLSRLLSSALAGHKGEGAPSKDFHNPVSLHLNRKERVGEYSRWRLLINDNEFTPEEPFVLTIQPSISLAGDSKLISIKHMEFSIKRADGRLIERGVKPKIEANFSRGEVLDYIVEFSDPGEHNYIVSCRCMGPKGVEIAGS